MNTPTKTVAQMASELGLTAEEVVGQLNAIGIHGAAPSTALADADIRALTDRVKPWAPILAHATNDGPATPPLRIEKRDGGAITLDRAWDPQHGLVWTKTHKPKTASGAVEDYSFLCEWEIELLKRAHKAKVTRFAHWIDEHATNSPMRRGDTPMGQRRHRTSRVRTLDAGPTLDIWQLMRPRVDGCAQAHPFVEQRNYLQLVRGTLLALEDFHCKGFTHCDLHKGNIALPARVTRPPPSSEQGEHILLEPLWNEIRVIDLDFSAARSMAPPIRLPHDAHTDRISDHLRSRLFAVDAWLEKQSQLHRLYDPEFWAEEPHGEQLKCFQTLDWREDLYQLGCCLIQIRDSWGGKDSVDVTGDQRNPIDPEHQKKVNCFIGSFPEELKEWGGNKQFRDPISHNNAVRAPDLRPHHGYIGRIDSLLLKLREAPKNTVLHRIDHDLGYEKQRALEVAAHEERQRRLLEQERRDQKLRNLEEKLESERTDLARKRLLEEQQSIDQEVIAAEWAGKAQTLIAVPKLNIADALAWQCDAAKAGAPLSKEPLAALKLQLADRVKVIEDLQHRVQVQREAAVLLAQRIEVLSTKSWRDAQAVWESLRADVDNWQVQATELLSDANWPSVDMKFPPLLEASRAQLLVVWDAFKGALALTVAAAEDGAAPLPPVQVWADQLRAARGVPIEAPAKPQKPKIDPAVRAQAVEAVRDALTKLELEIAQGHGKASAGAAAALRNSLKEFGKVIDDKLENQAHAALAAAGELEGWQRWRADPLREAGALGSVRAAPTEVLPTVGADDEEAELRDIFLNEAHDVVGTGVEAISKLLEEPSDLEQQVALRRAFRTLKGSSRMRGLTEFGEASWSYEQLLNSWLADQMPASESLLKVCGQALQGLSRWIEDIAEGEDAVWQARVFRDAADAMRIDGRVVELLLPGDTTEPVAETATEVDEPQLQPNFASTEFADAETLLRDPDGRFKEQDTARQTDQLAKDQRDRIAREEAEEVEAARLQSENLERQRLKQEREQEQHIQEVAEAEARKRIGSATDPTSPKPEAAPVASDPETTITGSWQRPFMVLATSLVGASVAWFWLVPRWTQVAESPLLPGAVAGLLALGAGFAFHSFRQPRTVASLRKAAEAGDAVAMRILAVRYANGRGGLPKDDAQAVVWSLKAAEAGDARAMTYLGVCYADGQGGLRTDIVEAVAWYHKAAEAGDATAMNYLGVCYANQIGGLPKDEAQAVAWYRKAADAGDAAAMTNLGVCYADGRGGLPKDDAQAVAWSLKAAEAGDARAMRYLGVCYADGRGGLFADKVEAVVWYRKAAEAGDARAMTYVGDYYANGRGGLPKDHVQAVGWYRKAADAGDARAMTELGLGYAKGQDGLPKDQIQAVAWYRKAADAGDARAMTYVGDYYANGRGGLPKDEARAVAWYHEAADAGDARAMNYLGDYYAKGRGGLPKDEIQAVAWYREAAEAGDAGAMNDLGVYHANGQGGLPKDEVQAAAWYRKAADAGNADAMYNLGAYHANGQGGLPKDEVQAAAWYRKAADAGNADAMYNLGVYHANGQGGLPMNQVQAVAWYRKAAEAGDVDAMCELGVCYESGIGGLPVDEVQAVAWYRKAAKAGSANAMYRIGVYHDTGQGVLPKDEVKAAAWYRDAANAGDVAAMCRLGGMCASGRGGLPKDDGRAIAWYRKAADAGSAAAMHWLGLRYESGRGGLPKDDTLAVAWYRKAADAGADAAMCKLGVMYIHGRGGLLIDDVQAAVWLGKAAASGDVPAMFWIGSMYADGRGGLPRNEVEAEAWFRKAAHNGNVDAMRSLGTMYAEGRGGLPKDAAKAGHWLRQAAESWSLPP